MITHPIPMVTECLVLTHNMHHQLEIPLLFFFFFFFLRFRIFCSHLFKVDRLNCFSLLPGHQHQRGEKKYFDKNNTLLFFFHACITCSDGLLLENDKILRTRPTHQSPAHPTVMPKQN